MGLRPSVAPIGAISSTDRCYYVGMKVKKYGRPYFDKV